ncbi:putative serine/threonine-protein phosphatase [Aspergillus clavatus NRRL 1]|uniref:Ser/Thr protein phosphatase family n=1 Tax=Aspergillus clavatus (strain ATCC 1007 / CBS 513.65 / DSM 816 / NCTC 3887 / NRRL 1 / QM 1276 / 107) TaxID=344612 RepID=A1CAJ6_ASPCL|nr:Ser/Thr protein phosphatase family [Aspergillus clavatus NRRL 1]EAW12764.1 Ser/Thr protein phosphatase family [Aspergillus clavatus NRRL 1]
MAPTTDRSSLEITDFPDDDFLPATTATVKSYQLNRFTRPLIDYVHNEWQANTKYVSLSGSPDGGADSPRWMQMFLSMVTAPRFRRYTLIYLVLLASCLAGWTLVLSPRLEENQWLEHSLDPQTQEEAGGWFGTNTMPRFEGVTHMRTLDKIFLPAVKAVKGEASSRRLIFIGDVHGCRDELELLLDEVSFDHERDHLIFTGDMISKGPDSPGVVDLARQYAASCVRGNHEDRILLLRHDMATTNTLPAASDGDIPPDLFFGLNSKERALARQLSDEQVQWLDACPVILDVGQIPAMGQVLVVHGGLVPGVALEKQDPSSVMNMLTIDLDTHVPSGKRGGMMWTKLFNKHQSLLYASQKGVVPDPKSKVTTVIYGHDAKTSLSLKTYTKGLDSGCVKGGKLTAMIIEDGGEQKVVQVRCRNYHHNQ